MLGALIGAGASLLGGIIGSNGAKSAANAQARSQQAAIDEQRRQFDTTRLDYAPYRTVGTGALNQLATMYGLPTYGGPTELPQATPAMLSGATGVVGSVVDRMRGGSGPTERIGVPALSNKLTNPGVPAASGANFDAFYNSPDYRFALEQGEQSVLRNRAALGGLASGNTLAELNRFGQGLASQQFGNFYNRLAGLAGIGQSATNSVAGYGAQSAGNIGNLMAAQGDARASGIASQANIWGNTLGTIGGIGYDYFRNRGG